MNAPDKIYLNIPGDYWHTEDCDRTVNDIEYIRKDALMKIIETARKSASIQRNFNNCPVEQEARIDTYDYIKREIDSL